jgi:hypothetical protein
VSKRSNVIEVNGKRYDALTGRLIDGPAPQPTTGLAIDGVAKQHHRMPTTPRTAHKVHQKTEKSKTLMRGAVHKPVAAMHGPVIVDGVRKSRSHPSKTTVAHSKHHQRSQRANAVPKSHLISKFGHEVPHTHTIEPHLDLVPVQAAPEHDQPSAQALFSTLHHTVNPFQNALEHATGHTQPKAKKTRAHHKLAHKMGVKPRFVSAGAALVSVLLIGGFFAYQNVPNLAMRVAAAKAGVQGGLPDYKPSGFSIKGPIQFTSGQVTIAYKSNSDDRSFSVVQRSSDWNSEALLKNYVAVDNRPYQTYQDDNKTIYIYDGSNATWVDQGVWYQIEGKSALSSDQLLRMATSL